MSIARRFLLCLSVASTLTVALGACSIPFRQGDDLQVNECRAADECGVDSTCAPSGEDNLCASTKADLAGVIFEIRPSAVAKFGAGTSYLINPTDQGVALQSTIAGPIPFDPALPTLVSISPGEVNCSADMSSIPAKVEFRRVAQLAGLPDDVVNAAPEPGEGSSFAFHIEVPPGVYNIYVEPESPPDAPIKCGGAPLPPVFIAGKEIAVNSTFRLEVEEPKNLTGTIQPPKDWSLQGWTVQVVEMNSGRRISSVQTIEHPDLAQPAGINLHYNFVSGVQPVLQLQPPADVIAPSLYWDLAAIDLAGMNNVQLSLADLTFTPREVEGHVLDADAKPVVASVTLQSTGLWGDIGNNAAYTIATGTDSEGLFNAKVPPGTYRVIAKPLNDEALATAEATWVIEDDSVTCFCGQVVTVPPKVTLEADVQTPNQGPLLQANVVASPSLPPPISYFDRQLGRAPELPREALGAVDAGFLSMAVDPGAFDFSVRPPPGSLFPWLVRSRLTVQPDSAEAFSSVGTLTIAHPVVVSGVVKDPFGDAVPGASIRAWLPVKDKEGVARTVIQVGEASTNESGGYTLYLPPSISQ